MGWRLRVTHTTEVSYTGPARASFNEVRMTPLTLPSQVALESRVSAGPGVPVWTYCDYWGTFVSVFDIGELHQSLTIRAQATVETGTATAPEPPVPSWPELRAESAPGRLLEFLLPTPLTTVTQDAAAAVLDTVRDADPARAAEEIAARVRSQVGYMAGATGVRTDAQEAWDQGQGVCQDIAHVTVALLRAAGLPARYVSGYLHADPGAEPGQTAIGESHAWVEYWAGSWRPLDPTSGAPVAERHVVVARGRDYGDVSPLKGIYHGAPATASKVTVEVTRLA
jgi:transglutaminase-like putative cysteine protease